MDRIVDRYHRVAEQCDAVVVGSDYTDVGAPAEFAPSTHESRPTSARRSCSC